MDTKIIFLPTVQHSGTWFLINFLTAHPDVSKFVEAKNIYGGTDGIEPGQVNLLHTHVTTYDYPVYKVRNYFQNYIAEAMIEKYPTVTPLRDPLLSIITRHSRHPDKDHRYIIAAYTWLLQQPKVFCLPVDTVGDSDTPHRQLLLKVALKVCGLDPYVDYVKQYAETWPVSNTAKDMPFNLPLKEMYKAKDLDGIEKLLPREIATLREEEKNLRPLLEKWGYCDLLWWS